MTANPRVALATIDRFHIVDLADQLHKRGCLAAMYTGLARRFVRAGGVPSTRIVSFPWLQTPIRVMQKLGLMPPLAYRGLNWWAHETLDRHVARRLVPCDVFVGLSSVGLHAGRVAKARGAIYVCSRGSAHIVAQDRLLAAEHRRLELPYRPIDGRFIDKHLAEYALADAVTVPSSFALRSFVEHGVAPDKLHLIPYGVDVAGFRPCAPRDQRFRVLFVGALSVQKGLHDLLEGFRRAALPGAELVLVGAAQPETAALLRRFPVADVDLAGPVARAEVATQMSRASVLVLPSVQDGMGLVLAQALACGCPVIASRNTGAEDLLADGGEGFIVPIRDPDAIAERLTRLHDDPVLRAHMGAAGLERVRALGGWDRYGDAALDLFRSLAAGQQQQAKPSLAWAAGGAGGSRCRPAGPA